MKRYRSLFFLAVIGLVFWLDTSSRLPPLPLPWWLHIVVFALGAFITLRGLLEGADPESWQDPR